MCLKYAGLKFLFRKALSTPPPKHTHSLRQGLSGAQTGFELTEILPTQCTTMPSFFLTSCPHFLFLISI